MFSRTINPSPFTVNNSRIPSPPSRVVPNDRRGDIHRALANNNNSNDSNQFFASVCSSSLYSSLRQSFPADDDDSINSNTNNSTTGLASTSGNDDVSVPPAVTVNAAVLNSEDEPTQFPSFVAEIQSNLPEFDEGRKLIAQAHQKFGPNCGMTGRVCNADSLAPNADEVLFGIMLSFCVEDMERMLQMKNRHEFVNPSINTVYRLYVKRFMQCGLTEEEAEDFVLNHSVWIDSSTAEASHDWRTHRDKKPSYVYLMETLGLRKLNSIMHKSLLECFPNLKIIVGFGVEAMEMLDLLREYFPRQINQQRSVHHPSQVYNGKLTNAQLHRLLRLTVFCVVDAILDREPTAREDQVDLSDYARTTKNSTAIEIRSLDGKLLGIFELKADIVELLGVSATTLYLNTDDEGVFSYFGKAFLQMKKIKWTGIDFGETDDGADDLRRIIEEMAAHREAFYVRDGYSNPVEVKSLDGMTLAIVESPSKAAELLGVNQSTVCRNTNADGVFAFHNKDMCQIQPTNRKDFGETDDGADDLRRIIQEIAARREAFYKRKSKGTETRKVTMKKGKGTDTMMWNDLNYLRVYNTNGKYIGTASSINEVSKWINVEQGIIEQFLQTTNDGVLSIDGTMICRLEKVMIGLVPGGETDLEEIRKATSAIATDSFEPASPSSSELTDVEVVSTAACAASISSEGEEILCEEAMSAITTKVIEGEGRDIVQKPAATATTSTSKTTNLTSISIPSHADICSIIPDEANAITFLTTHGVFPNLKDVVCAHCGYKGCRIKGKKQPKSLKCNRCSKGQSLMKGTLFEKSKVPLHQALYMARFWLSMSSASTVIAQLGCSSATVTEWFGKFRVHAKKCLNASPNEGLGNRDPEQIKQDMKVHIPRYARKNDSDHFSAAMWRDLHVNNLWSAFLESLKTVKYETEAVAADKKSAPDPETDNKRKATSKAVANPTKKKRAKQRKD